MYDGDEKGQKYKTHAWPFLKNKDFLRKEYFYYFLLSTRIFFSQEYKSKLEKVAVVRKELKSHIQSLPDLSLLPDMHGLAPLPAAGDLFDPHKELGID